MGVNKVAVLNVFDLLTKVIDEHRLITDTFFNVDKTNITVNPKGYSSILKLKGCHPVGALGSAEKGGTVRGVMCFSASGVFMPPMLIVPRKRRMQQDFQLNVCPGAWVQVYETGWMTKPLFCTWLKKLIEFLGAWKGSTVLFLLGRLVCCTKSLQLISIVR